MSVSGIIDSTNIDPDYKGKIYPDLIPWAHPEGQQGLGSVLQINSSAYIPNTTTAQDATDFATLGCVKIETGTVGMGNQPALVIGEAGDLLQIKGATLLGSILSGNGVNTETLPLGTNGYVLTADSNAGVGVKWNPAGGAGVASITEGNNIGVNNAIPTAPVVSLKAPLTTTLNMGAVALTDSAGAVGLSGQVLTAGTGGQTLWGTNGVSSITAGTNISITGTGAVPIVNLRNPLTATLNLGTQNCQGTSSQITLTNGGSQAGTSATVGFYSGDSTTPTTNSTLFKTGLTLQTATNNLSITPTSIAKTGSSTLSIQSSTPINISGLSGGSAGIQIAQSLGSNTTLTTNIANVNYYPDFVLTNQNLNTTSVPAPSLQNQRLTLNNLGLSSVNSWVDYGSNVYTGYSAFVIDSNNYIWLAEQGSGNIQVWDNTITTLQYTLQLTYGGGAGTINAFYLQGGFMWIGGLFDTVADANGVNATGQYSITRVAISSYLFDPVENSSSLNRGFQNGSQVYCMTDVNGALVCGGTFTTDELTTTSIKRIGSISNPYVAGGSQVWSEYGNGADNSVYAILHSASLNYTFVGGDFNTVNVSVSPVAWTWCAFYDNASGVWGGVASGFLNSSVYIIKPSFNGYILIAGAFTSLGGSTQDYNAYIEEANPANFADTTLNLSGLVPSYKQGTFTAGANALMAFDNTLHTSSAYQVWTSLGQTGAGGTISGINLWNGVYKVIGDSYGYVRSYVALNHACAFTGNFIYDNTSYGTYTITQRNVSQQFLGDYASATWSIIGVGVGAFS